MFTQEQHWAMVNACNHRKYSMCTCNEVTSHIANPAQMQFAFFTSAHQYHYNDGYNAGVNWDGNWMPGGPHRYTCRVDSTHPNYARWKRMELDDQDKYDAWHAGFNAGLAHRLATNSHFAAWWTENKGKRTNGIYYMRYTDLT